MLEKNEKFDQEPDQHEELNRLKQDINANESHRPNVDKETDRLDVTKSYEKQNELHDNQTELVTLRTDQEVKELQKEITQTNPTNQPMNYETMRDDEIAQVANIERANSANNVDSLVQKTSRIPWFIKNRL